MVNNLAYVHVPKEKQPKLDAKDKNHILVGYSDKPNAYKCYCRESLPATTSCSFGYSDAEGEVNSAQVECEK